MLYSLAIVDDEPAIRSGLTKHFDWESLGFRVAATFEDGEDVLSYLAEHHLDALLADIRMSVVSGLSLAEAVADQNIPTEIVLLSGYREFEYARRAMRAGVFRYLLKPTQHHEIVEVFSELRQRLDRSRHNTTRDTADAEKAISGSGVDEQHMDTKKEETRDRGQTTVERAMEYVEDRLALDLTLEHVARELYVSPGYFGRLFKQQTGRTYLDYVTERRIEFAKKLLLRKDRTPVVQVAQLVGYQDPKYFGRLFKSRTGQTPSQFRRSHRWT